MPPSAITGTPARGAGRPRRRSAVSCGTPTPETTRVVQIERTAPCPTLMPSAPASISAVAPSAVATLPATRSTLGNVPLDRPHGVDDRLRVAVRRVDHQHVDAGPHERLGALLAIRPGADRGADPQAAELVLGGVAGSGWPSRCP